MEYEIQSSQNDCEELKLLEEGLWQSNFRFDISKMEKFLAPDFFEFGRSGRIYQRADTLNVPSQEIPCVIPLINFKVRFISFDVAQITYISIVNYPEGEERSLRSSIWSRSDNKWQLKFHQGTPLKMDK
ncbi:MAG: nuclear transport factor 2 family protein [Pleurocapsa sp. MO_192.B19]|nr:nuclear transport factor 2 family protein [Pleurocapsa sp. MO_192.B19]